MPASCPPLAYALFGSSMTQSVGPMAITSLMSAPRCPGSRPRAPPSTSRSRHNSRCSRAWCCCLWRVAPGISLGFPQSPGARRLHRRRRDPDRDGPVAPLLLTDAAAHPDVPSALIGGASLRAAGGWHGARCRAAPLGRRPWPVFLRLAPAAMLGAAALALLTTGTRPRRRERAGQRTARAAHRSACVHSARTGKACSHPRCWSAS